MAVSPPIVDLVSSIDGRFDTVSERSMLNHRRKHLVLAIAVVAISGALLTFWIGSRRTAVDPTQHATATQDPATPPPRDSAGTSTTAALQVPASDELGEQSTRALRDPAYLRELLARYSQETDMDRRSALIALLQSVGNDEVMRFALQLAQRGDPASRKDGLRLLQAFPLDRAPVRELLTTQLQNERDPGMQKEILDMLTPAVMPLEDAAPLVAELSRLRTSPDPEVRAASVLQTPQWDRQSDLEPMLHAALVDPATQVRQAAIAGINANHLRSPRLKDALLAIAIDAQAPQEERSAAVFALQDFALSRAEYALYREAAGTAADHDSHEGEMP